MFIGSDRVSRSFVKFLETVNLFLKLLVCRQGAPQMKFMIPENRFYETAQKITDAHTTNVQHPFVATFCY